MNEAIKMQLSAFVDGELLENEKELLLRRLSQDAALRQQVAEYLAIGRAMRNETQLVGANELRSRVADALNDKPLQDSGGEVEPGRNRLLRPLAGFAVAATVAMVAILGLRQTAVIEDLSSGSETLVDTESFPTQPEVDDVLRQYRLLHDASASDQGANSIRTRLTAFELGRQDAVEVEQSPMESDDESEVDANDQMTE